METREKQKNVVTLIMVIKNNLKNMTTKEKKKSVVTLMMMGKNS